MGHPDFFVCSLHWVGAKSTRDPSVDLYSGEIIVFFYDLDDGVCFLLSV